MNAEEKFVVPSTQFVENPEGYELKVSLPGIGKEDAELHVEGRTLVLRRTPSTRIPPASSRSRVSSSTRTTR